MPESGAPAKAVGAAATTSFQAHQSVTATHGTERASEGSQLFYGPSSNFAFLQQVHRSILSRSASYPASNQEVQEGGPGLDMFMQRIFFFGPPSSIAVPSSPGQALPVSLEQATVFLKHFKATSRHILPFFADQELDELLQNIYHEPLTDRHPLTQHHSIVLAILAVGALSTDETSTAEMLFARAKSVAAVYEDVVTLSMIQLSLVLADYQINMGRPNSAYLQLGVACRKAFAMGLHKDAANLLTAASDLSRRRTTLWCLYVQESWHALAMGRKSALRLEDISCPFPSDLSTPSGLCQLASIAEDAAAAIYGRRYGSLTQLHTAAEAILRRLHSFAHKFSIGSYSANASSAVSDEVGLLQLHGVYYHVVMLTFRPFLLDRSAAQGRTSTQINGQMWLRQACRYATDAAQDSIVFISDKIRTTDACKSVRYMAFFLESGCAVLLYDILCNPTKHSYNLEFIQVAVETLGAMVSTDVRRSAQASILQILQVVKQCISSELDTYHSSADGVTTFQTPVSAPPGPDLTLQGDSGHPLYPNILFPSLSRDAPASVDELIYFSGRMPQFQNFPNTGQLPADIPVQDPGNSHPFDFNFDVLTTDLYSLFSMQVTTPGDGVG